MKVFREQTDILLMEYAAGALDQASALLMASYVTVCPEARRYLRKCESVGGALIEHCCEPVEMSAGSLKTVLGRIGTPCEEGDSAEEGADDRDLPQPVAAHYRQCGAAPRWRAIAPGLRVSRLPAHGHGAHQALLARLAPGARVPAHRHEANEMTLILQGGYRDEHGSYSKGDLIISEAGSIHRPVADGREGCTCIMVTQSLPRFTGRFYSVLNIFIR